MAGAPKSVLAQRNDGPYLGVNLQGLTFIKPHLAVETGDRVKIGDILFYDKNNPNLQFLSPAAGEVIAVDYGSRRALRQIIIKRAVNEEFVAFPAFNENELARLERDALVQQIALGGLWYLLRELPFRDAANMAAAPARIFVVLDSLEPFKPKAEIYLAGNEALFAYGLNVLRKLCHNNPPTLIINADNHALLERFAGEDILGFQGRYPAHDPGVLLYHTKTGPAQNRAWYIDGQDLLQIAGFLSTGRYPTQRIYAVGGVPLPAGHVKARLGANVAEITGFAGWEHWRVIAGSVFSGYATAPESFAGPLDNAFFVMHTGKRQGRFVAWMLFGVKTVTSFKAHLSAWLPKRKRALNCNMHGGLRSCIACNQCVRLCPVDILPSLMWKTLLAGAVEEALAHGLLDCVECGLCSYGCPSKIELTEAFIKAKADFYKESA